MPRFFVDGAPAQGVFSITGEDAHHIARVLRMQPGEALTVCDGSGLDYACVYAGNEDGAALCRVVSSAPSRGEPSV